ncbi:MAG: protein kinase, partial [Pseudomonadota bacterium]
MNLQPGELFADQYRVERVLGKGGMGYVYAVRDARFPERLLALKLLPVGKPELSGWFASEFSFLAVFNHPHIVRVFDYGIDRATSTPFYTAELLDGVPLPDPDHRWSEEELADVLARIGSALSFLHSRGLIHGDIKPANIMRVGDSRRFVLVDFGLATKRDSREADETVRGTPKFMAPEVQRGTPPDERSDLYSLGLTVWFLAAGEVPSGSRPASLRAVRPDLSEALDEVVRKLLSRNPEGRYRHAGQLLAGLRRTIPSAQTAIAAGTPEAQVAFPFLLGRDRFVESLLAVLDRHHPFAALIGPPGIGKTRVLKELRLKLQLLGKAAFLYDCVAISGPNFLEDFAAYLRAPGEAVPMPAEDPLIVSDRYEILVQWIGRKLSERPLVLLLDDFDRMPSEDRSAVVRALMRLKAAGVSGLSVLAAVETESAFASAGPELPVERFRLPPLKLEDASDFFQTLQPRVHPAVVRAFHEKSGGVPLLMEAVAKVFLPSLDAWPRLEFEQEVRKVDLRSFAPEALRSAVGKASEQERYVLRLLAAAARPLPVASLQAGREILHGLFESGLVRTASENGLACVTLESPVTAAAVLSDTSPADLEILHGKVADLLARDGADAGLISSHFLRSERPESGVPYLGEAIRRFHRQHAHGEAVALLETARPCFEKLGLLHSDTEFLLMAGEICTRAGRTEEASWWLENAHGEIPRQKVDVLHALSSLRIKQRDLGSALALVGQAYQLLEKVPDPDRTEQRVRLDSVKQIASLLAGDFSEVERLGQAIENMPETLFREKVRSLCLRGHADLKSKQFDKARELYETALHESEARSYGPGISMAQGSLALYHQARDDDERALKAYSRAIEAAEEAFDFQSVATHRINSGVLCEKLGRYADALRAYERGVDLFRSIGDRRDYAHALYRKGKLHFFLSRDPRCASMLSEAHKAAERAGDADLAAFALAALAEVTPAESTARERWTKACEIFRKRGEADKLGELNLIAFERKWSNLAGPLRSEVLPTPLRVRALEALDAQALKAESSQKELRDGLEDRIAKEKNPEWSARYWALLAGERARPKESDKASDLARKALHLFQRLSSSLDEELQSAYLSIRHCRELAELAGQDAQDTVQDSGSDSEASHLSVRVARQLSSQAISHLLDTIKKLNQMDRSEPLVDSFVDAAIGLTGAERGALFEFAADPPLLLSARSSEGRWMPDIAERISRGVLEKAVRTRQVISERRVAESEEWKDRDSLVLSSAHSFICVPFEASAGTAAVLYLDRTRQADPFASVDSYTAAALTEHFAVMLAKHRREDEVQRQKERIDFLNRRLKEELAATGQIFILPTGTTDAEVHSEEIIGSSAAVRRLKETIEQAAVSDAPVFIAGESGTGKE